MASRVVASASGLNRQIQWTTVGVPETPAADRAFENLAAGLFSLLRLPPIVRSAPGGRHSRRSPVRIAIDAGRAHQGSLVTTTI